ncbi:hypothetical protein NDU88_005101 [Pleurodeles waltl]|uniref:Uncharacterized protein n=1 Tax=Pleurodeles waltl TaxID=8319 RepID=A0AAV7WTT1_PLEWA|nr:hypothetical protein NDU88_005101 [Pleurodeles waltl]
MKDGCGVQELLESQQLSLAGRQIADGSVVRRTTNKLKQMQVGAEEDVAHLRLKLGFYFVRFGDKRISDGVTKFVGKKNPGVRMSHNEGERGLTSIDGMCGASEQAIFCLQPFSKGQVGPGAASGSHYPLLYFRERGNDEESLDWASEWQSKECNPFKDWMEIEGGCDASEDVEDAEKSGRD